MSFTKKKKEKTYSIVNRHGKTKRDLNGVDHHPLDY